MSAQKKEKITAFEADVIEMLKDDEFAKEFISDLSQDLPRDEKAFLNGLSLLMKARGGASLIAKQAHISRDGLYKMLRPNGNPSFGTVLKIMRALGLEAEVKMAAPKKKKTA